MFGRILHLLYNRDVQIVAIAGLSASWHRCDLLSRALREAHIFMLEEVAVVILSTLFGHKVKYRRENQALS